MYSVSPPRLSPPSLRSFARNQHEHDSQTGPVDLGTFASMTGLHGPCGRRLTWWWAGGRQSDAGNEAHWVCLFCWCGVRTCRVTVWTLLTSPLRRGRENDDDLLVLVRLAMGDVVTDSARFVTGVCPAASRILDAMPKRPWRSWNPSRLGNSRQIRYQRAKTRLPRIRYLSAPFTGARVRDKHCSDLSVRITVALTHIKRRLSRVLAPDTFFHSSALERAGGVEGRKRWGQRDVV